MRSVRKVRIAGTIALGAVLFLSWGCGYKNLPVPPESVVPKPIVDLRYVLDDKGVSLNWAYPVETIKGTDIRQISSFDLYMAEIAVDDYCPTCPIPFGEPIEMDGGMTTKEGQRQRATYENSMLRTDHKYFFKVQSKNNWWASSADSNIVTFVWSIPTAAATGLIAKAGDSRVELSWQPVTTLRDGKQAKGDVSYQVLRRTAKAEFSPLGEPVNSTSFVDEEVQNDSTYQYKVQSIIEVGGDPVVGGISESVSASPADKTPPAQVVGVTAIESGGEVKVIWDGSRDPDLGGYRIYRRTEDSSTYELIGNVGAPYTIFVDTTASGDETSYYSVTAIDTSEPPNESEKSEEATLRH